MVIYITVKFTGVILEKILQDLLKLYRGLTSESANEFEHFRKETPNENCFLKISMRFIL